MRNASLLDRSLSLGAPKLDALNILIECFMQLNEPFVCVLPFGAESAASEESLQLEQLRAKAAQAHLPSLIVTVAVDTAALMKHVKVHKVLLGAFFRFSRERL